MEGIIHEITEEFELKMGCSRPELVILRLSWKNRVPERIEAPCGKQGASIFDQETMSCGHLPRDAFAGFSFSATCSFSFGSFSCAGAAGVPTAFNP